MKKIILTAIIASAVLGGIIFAGVRFLGREDLDGAIDDYEDQEYVGALRSLNRLSRSAGYDTLEKIHYYRCKSINRLAEQLEADYDEELREAALEKKGTPEFEKARTRLEKKLRAVNEKIKGDLTLTLARVRSRIVPRGAFYDEFISRFRGSSYIEDLHFEEVEKLGKTDPSRQIPALMNFYGQYPRTNYLSAMIKILFDALQKGNSAFQGKEDVLFNMIVAYGKRHPTSPEINKIFQCTGDNVNLRNAPGVEGKLMGKVKRDEILIQLEKSMDTAQVGDVRDYWYRVASLAGSRGWIFGKFITPIDLTKFQTEEKVETWAMEELFADWTDSNTPKNWSHLAGDKKEAIGFTANASMRMAVLQAPKGSITGLYSRYSSPLSFTVRARGRLTKGDGFTLFAYVLPGGSSYYVKLLEEKVDVDGRIIPLHTMDWHDYQLESADGRYATLSIDGEIVSGRIEPVKSGDFTLRGVYCLHSRAEQESFGEMEYIKIR